MATALFAFVALIYVLCRKKKLEICSFNNRSNLFVVFEIIKDRVGMRGCTRSFVVIKRIPC